MAGLMMNQRIDFNNPVTTKPANLANSAVLRMLEEEEERQRNGQIGKYSRGRQEYDPHRRTERWIEWPPKTSSNGDMISMNCACTSRFFTPNSSGLKRVAWPPPPEENGEETPVAPVKQAAPEKIYQSPALTRLIPIEREFAPSQSKVYSPQPPSATHTFAPVSPIPKPQSPQIYSQSPQLKPVSPQPNFARSPLSPQANFSRSPLSPQASTPTQIFPPPLPEEFAPLQKTPSPSFNRPSPRAFAPVQSDQSFAPVNFNPVSFQPFAPTQGLVSAAPSTWAPVSPTPNASAQSQFVEPPPAVVTLRQAAPVHQAPPPVVTSQPATNSFQGGVNMRGDQKWPPQSVKEATAAENDARVQLAKGPACRPRKIKRDYTNFFAQNALPHNYPGYRAPPGTQHFEDHTGNSQF